MKAYATKLVDLAENNAEALARQWAKDVRSNVRTPSYHQMSEERLVVQAIEFYHQFARMFVVEKPQDAAIKYFADYAEKTYKEGVPLHEALYALVLMRRHIWLYAEFQVVFITAIEHQLAVETLNRTILMFDYAMYVISRTFNDLLRREIGRKLGAK